MYSSEKKKSTYAGCGGGEYAVVVMKLQILNFPYA